MLCAETAPSTVHPHVRGDNATPTAGDVTFERFTPTCVGTILHTHVLFGVLGRISPSKSAMVLLVSPEALTENPCSVSLE